MMRSLSYKEFDEQDIEQLLGYINHLNKFHKVIALWVHPNYWKKIYAKIHNKLLSSHMNNGFDKLDMGNYTINILIVSSMNGDFCIVTEDMLTKF